VTPPDVISPDPLARFQDSYARALAAEPTLPDAVTLATADRSGRPSARVVLLKGIEAGGFVFYSNYDSRKGHQLAENPFGALCFHWKSLGEQVRAEGRVERLSAEISDAYFLSRPRMSQIAALASHQSRVLSRREELQQRFEALAQRYADRPPERPPHWGGYVLVPDRIEFWKNGEHRLHERELYERQGDGWRLSFLNP
jgi:pyridoxamine 5'-phosphate oxidase